MKITDLKTTLVSVPHTEPEFISTGMRKGVTQCLIELETDEGVTGLGESICRPNAPVIEAAVQSCKPLLVGSDPNNIEAVVNNIRHIGNWHFFERVGNVAVGGIEMALWDIVGKACGKPLYELLGGMVRDRMPIFYYLFRFELDEMERRARKAVEDGWQLIYFKVGHDIHADIEAVEAVRGAVGSKAGIRIDANEAWTPGAAVRFIKQIEKFDVEFVEQPTPAKDFDGLAHVPSCDEYADRSEPDLLDAAGRARSGEERRGGCDRDRPVHHRRSSELQEGRGDLRSSGTTRQSPLLGRVGYRNRRRRPHGCLVSPVPVRQSELRDDSRRRHHRRRIAENRKRFDRRPPGSGLGITLDSDRVAAAAQRYREQGEFPSRLAHDKVDVTIIPKF